MSQVVTVVRLSGSTDGKQIKIAATATAGTTIHTAHATAGDRIFLFAVNTSASPVKLTIEYGGTTPPDDLIEQWIQPESGSVPVLVGNSPLTNSVVVRGFAGTADVIEVSGYVFRIV